MQIDLSIGLVFVIMVIFPMAAAGAMVWACKRKLSRLVRGVLAVLSILMWVPAAVLYFGAWPNTHGDERLAFAALGLFYMILGATELYWIARWFSDLPRRELTSTTE